MHEGFDQGLNHRASTDTTHLLSTEDSLANVTAAVEDTLQDRQAKASRTDMEYLEAGVAKHSASLKSA